ncbi:MAG: hypothetical protein ACKVT1_02570 [Dehalococcoidia bacterium]
MKEEPNRESPASATVLDGPVGFACRRRRATTPLSDWGDGLMAPGTNNPCDAPGHGGAKFSRPDPRDQWQWEIVNRDGKEFRAGVDREKARDVLLRPDFHSNIPSQAGLLLVASCSGSRTLITLEQQLRELLLARVGPVHGEGSACDLHETGP